MELLHENIAFSLEWQRGGRGRGRPSNLRAICNALPVDVDVEPLLKCGVPDTRPRKKWRVDRLMPTVGVGLLLAATIMSAGQSFCGRDVRELCGALFLAMEGDFDPRDRIEAAVQARYPELPLDQAPIWWREGCPTLLAANAEAQLVAGIQAAAMEMANRFKLQLGW